MKNKLKTVEVNRPPTTTTAIGCNAIVLVDCVLQLQRKHGLSVVSSLVVGGRRRLRPILMTTLTTVLGLMPIAMGVGEGGELQAPMGRVLIGGLISSAFITLFVIPRLFSMMERSSVTEQEEGAYLPGAEPVTGI